MISKDFRTPCLIAIILGGALLFYFDRQQRPWRLSVYEKPDFTGKQVISRKYEVREDWKGGRPAWNMPTNHFSARWDTCLRVAEASPTALMFSLASDDGSRVFLDGSLIVDNWRPAIMMSPVTKTVQVPKGMHHLRVEFIEHGGAAAIKLKLSDDLPSKTQGYWSLSYPNSSDDGGISCET